MSSSLCAKCGLLSVTLLPSGLCPTCHAASSPTSVAELDRPTTAGAITVTFGAVTDTETRSFSADPRLIPTQPGQGYELGDLIGEGGMGRVFRAIQLSTGQVVAIKMIRADRLTAGLFERFVSEARSLAKLNHPNVVRVYDFNPDPRDPQLVMELVKGEPLSKGLDKRPLDPKTAAKLIADAARGVHAAHDEKVTHYDLKPQNILLTKDEVVKVADFGLAQKLDDDGNSADDELLGGTPGFMSPEQVPGHAAPEQEAGGSGSGVRTDVWGLGATLYAVLTGKPPFPTGKKNAERVLIDPLIPPRLVNPNVPRVLNSIVCKCLEKDPAKRYATAAKVAEELEKFRHGRSTEVDPLTWWEEVRERAKRMQPATIAAWVLGLVLVGTIIAAITLGRPPRDGGTPIVVTDEQLKADELERIHIELQAGRKVILVPRDGLPRWYDWLAGASVFSPNTMRDGGIQFQTAEGSCLRLIDDPMVNSYRLEAEFRHIRAERPHSRCGLFLGFEDRIGPTGDLMRAALTWEFSDYWDSSEITDEVRETHSATLMDRVTYQRAVGVNPNPHTFQLANHRFTPAVIEGGVWRKLAIEADPGGMVGYWWDDGKRDWVEAFRVTQSWIAENRQKWIDSVLPKVESPLVAPVWFPRRSLGIYAFNGTICFRDVTLQPKK